MPSPEEARSRGDFGNAAAAAKGEIRTEGYYKVTILPTCAKISEAFVVAVGRRAGSPAVLHFDAARIFSTAGGQVDLYCLHCQERATRSLPSEWFWLSWTGDDGAGGQPDVHVRHCSTSGRLTGLVLMPRSDGLL